MIYTLTLNPSLDVDLTVESLVPDDSNRVRRRREYPGGKGLNVSRVAKVLGGRTMGLVVTGGGTGERVGHLLREDEVPFETLEVEAETRTNTIISEESTRRVTRINERGQTLSERVTRVLFDKLELLDLRAVSYLVLGGSLPGDTPKDLYLKIIKRLNAKGDPCRILLDADGETLARALEVGPALIKPNTHEAARALGHPVEGLEGAIAAAREFREKGVETVLLTMGRAGVVACGPAGTWHAVPPEVEAVSAVGSGDSFIAGYLTSKTLGLDERSALVRACAAGAATALTSGTELCHPEDVARLGPKVQVERLAD